MLIFGEKMGTNYFQRTDICECCGRYKEKHIGKSSGGWKFFFQGYTGYKDVPKIASFEDWKKELQADGKIFDEYGVEVLYEDFVRLVESKNEELKKHYDFIKENAAKHGWDISNDWRDDEGYSFTRSEFS